jgi:hypothetical protein
MTETTYAGTDKLVTTFRDHVDTEYSFGRELNVEIDVRELAPWLADFASNEAALIELHSSMLRYARRVTNVPENMTTAAAVIFGLTRAVQHGTRQAKDSYGAYAIETVPEDVVLACVAHVLAAVHSPTYLADHARHLDLARSWMAQAYLHAGVATAGEAR